MPLRIRDQTKSNLIGTSMLAALTLAACVSILVLVKPGNSATWVIILSYVVIIGVCILPAAGVAVLARHARRFGQGTLVLTSTPLQPGGPLVGHVEVTRRLENVSGFRLTFAFVEIVQHSRRQTEHALWKEEATLAPNEVLFRAAETIVPINFTIPDEPPPVKRPLTGRHRWKLTIEALPDVAPYFTAEFYLPPNALALKTSGVNPHLK